MADQAQFYIGECNYSDGKYQEAVAAYNQVITTYPRGQSVAPAYYKRGLAFERMQQLDRARESFQQVIKNFPDSDAARLAKQNLDRLNKGKPQ
jgi:TolA-binding protein